MDKQVIAERVKRYLQAQAAYDAAKQERDAAKEQLVKALPKEPITIGIPDGKIEHKPVESIGGLTKTLLKESLEQYWATKGLAGSSQELLEHVWNSRQKTSKWDLKLNLKHATE